MSGRHRRTKLLRRLSVRTPLVIASVLVVATGTLLVLQNLADAGGCSSGQGSGIRLPVAADPAIAPALREVADDWARTEPEVDGRCIAVDVTEAATAEVASLLASSAGGFVNVGGSTPSPSPPPASEVPAVWVPDSTYWLARLQSVSRDLFEPTSPALATSPIVLGASPAGAQLVGEGPVAPADLREPLLGAVAGQQPLPVRLAEPRRDTAGLVGAGWLREAVVTAEEELPNLVAVFRGLQDTPADTATLLGDGLPDGPMLIPVSAQAVTAYNRTGPATPIAAVPVAEAPALDFPYAILDRRPRDIQTAATRFRTALTSASEVFARHGFDGVDGPATPVGPPERVTQTLRIWISSTSHARVLSVVNINSSMQQPMTTAGGALVPRIQVFQAAALEGMPLFTSGTDLGHWEYASQLDGDRDWVERVPIETLTDEHRAAIEQAIGSVQTVAANESALFETLLAAYQEMKEGYDPARSNTLIMWTDSGNNAAGSPTLEETLAELERLADVTRPVRVILLGIGPDADMTQLEAIAQATGGGAFHVQDPEEIGLVFLRALLT